MDMFWWNVVGIGAPVVVIGAITATILGLRSRNRRHTNKSDA
ncbi:hypothetical protein [Frigoribacterium sp. VKM Ac-2836]|nr:hypothetical protein [Frigoribacterium sp. VKM Ac-2836]